MHQEPTPGQFSQPLQSPQSPQPFPGPAKPRKKRFVIGGLCLVGLALVVVGVIGLKHDANTQKTTEVRSQSLAKADDLSYKSNFGGEVEALKQYLATKPPQQEANEATVKLATAYINNGDFEQAITYYKQAQSANDSRFTIEVLNGLAVAYTMKKDNATAIKYYQRVIELNKAKNKDYDTSTYDNIIKNLQQ